MIVDDDRLSRVSMVKQLAQAGYETEGFSGGYKAIDNLKGVSWDVVITDLRMPTMDGIQLLKAVKRISPDTEIIVITAYSSVDSAVEAMREGAMDYLTKPFNFSELEIRLEKLKKILGDRQQLRYYEELAQKSGSFHGLVGSSTAMEQVFEKIRVFGPHTAPVLIIGETGTGKELVARAIHLECDREPFIAVPCGAIPRDLAESELFGHEKGAFTGAIQCRKGRFEQAHGGTLFLDDIDDLPLEIQPKFLRVLQEGHFERVGGDKSISVDVRVVTASKKDLKNLVKTGHFREDLNYRLNVMTIELPPLREKKEDIILLAQYFLEGLSTRSGHQAKTLSEEASQLLLDYSWPGNVRELQAAIELANAVTKNDVIEASHLPKAISSTSSEEPQKPFILSLRATECVNLKDLSEQFEREVIHWALLKSKGHQLKAAEILGIPRTTLQSKISKDSDNS
jgi:DNA-binding NtrC family response regulator